MPRIIFKCRYIKNSAAHLKNAVEYIATREGVEKISPEIRMLPVTEKQEQFITNILLQFPDSVDLFEYEDYMKQPTVENASEFISAVLDQNLDHLSHQEVYVNYIATRPRAEKVGTHGLFTDVDTPLILSKVVGDVAGHTGNVWTPIISLRREDAVRLGYDNAAAWMALIRKQRNMLAEQMRIAPENLRWYAAFHNEGHHPHCHMLVYSINPRQGYVTKPAIDKMRSSMAREVFHQDLIQIYSEQTAQRNELAAKSREVLKEIIGKMSRSICYSETVEALLSYLAERLKHTSGKKQYGYLKAPMKTVVDKIVDELAKDARVAEAYAKWQVLRNEVLRTYMDMFPNSVPLSQQKEFKHIKNIIITEAMNIAGHHFTFEGDESADEFQASMEFDSPLPMDKYQAAMDEASEHDNTDSDHVNSDKTVELLTKAANSGNSMALYALAKLYRDGTHVVKDIEKALELFTKAAEQNNSFAMYQLGKLYLLGEDVPKDMVSAVKWLTKSAELGSQYAQYALGKLYIIGRDVPRDRDAAVHWLTRSAEQGSIHARFFLEHLDSIRVPTLFLAATRLLHHLSRLFRDEQKRLSGNPSMQTDSKLRRKIREKKIAQGHAPEDHELRQTTY